MEPLVEAVQLRANATSGAASASMQLKIRDELLALGGADAEGWERLWRAYITAARDDLAARP